MGNGLLFFYLAWILWIIITFIMPKTKTRTVLAVFILLCLCFANHYIEIGIPVSVTFLILLLGLVYYLFKRPKTTYYFICTLTIATGYAAMLLWEANTTIWLFMSRDILIPGTIVCLSIFLTNGRYNRLICSMLGLCLGDIFFKLTIYHFSFKDMIGDMAFLDIISVTVILHIMIILISLIKEKLYANVSRMTLK